MKILLAYRLVRVLLHVLSGVTICALLFPWLGNQARNRRIRRWSGQLLGMCNVRVELAPGAESALEQVMVVCNHVSWLDIFVILSVHPCRFVAKSEIRGWPMLGWLADKAGTIFIARGNRRDLRHLFTGLVEKLLEGQRVAFFPEGTTAAQGNLLPFHPNLFEAAIDAKVPVQPFAVSYLDGQGTVHPAVDFIGDTSFAESLAAILGGPPVRARLACLAPIGTEGAHRRELAQASYQAVATALASV
ncbi:MAG TPA: lysophospholipid acyltransferase family protein [Janthinobacterium sp.]|nr:lysophospholipid acyltransferase family protein [Janthinobacterium sp.]